MKLRGDGSSRAKKAAPTGDRPRPAPPPPDEPLCPTYLKGVAETWGTQFADTMICDPKWPKCDQARTIRAARAVVARAIQTIIATLNESADFRPHTPMMASSIRAAFDASLPH